MILEKLCFSEKQCAFRLTCSNVGVASPHRSSMTIELCFYLSHAEAQSARYPVTSNDQHATEQCPLNASRNGEEREKGVRDGERKGETRKGRKSVKREEHSTFANELFSLRLLNLAGYEWTGSRLRYATMIRACLFKLKARERHESADKD